MPSERRVQHRLQTRDSTVRSPIVFGRVLNLSSRGLAVETTTGLRIGARHRMKITAPRRQVVVEATVRWCRLLRLRPGPGSDVVPIYRAGLEIRSDDRSRSSDLGDPA